MFGVGSCLHRVGLGCEQIDTEKERICFGAVELPAGETKSDAGIANTEREREKKCVHSGEAREAMRAGENAARSR